MEKGKNRNRLAQGTALFAATLVLTGCNLGRTVAHEADNPAVREAGEELAQRAGSAGQAGDEAAPPAQPKVTLKPAEPAQPSRPVKKEKRGDTESSVELTVGVDVYVLETTHVTGAWDDRVVSVDEVYEYDCSAAEAEFSTSGDKELHVAASTWTRESATTWYPEEVVYSLLPIDGVTSPCNYVFSKLNGTE